jgi:predicted hydrocarbon binding protein
MVFLVKYGRELVGFEIELNNVPGALAYISSVPEKFGLNIYYVEILSLSEDKYDFFMGIDFTDSRVLPSMLLDEIKKDKKYVIDAKLAPEFKDIIYTSKFYVRSLDGLRALLFGIANMMGVAKGIKRELGIEAGSNLLYHLGYGVGEETRRIYSDPRSITSVEDGIMLIRVLTRGSGWADLFEYEVSERRIILRFKELWECEIHKDKEERPVGSYMRGILTGYFQKLLKRPITTKETKCIAKGDPYCEFQIWIHK